MFGRPHVQGPLHDLKIVILPIGSLRPNPRNARTPRSSGRSPNRPPQKSPVETFRRVPRRNAPICVSADHRWDPAEMSALF